MVFSHAHFVGGRDGETYGGREGDNDKNKVQREGGSGGGEGAGGRKEIWRKGGTFVGFGRDKGC